MAGFRENIINITDEQLLTFISVYQVDNFTLRRDMYGLKRD